VRIPSPLHVGAQFGVRVQPSDELIDFPIPHAAIGQIKKRLHHTIVIWIAI
jgi:hypothetical protein